MMLEKNIQSIMQYKPYMINLIEELDKEEYRYDGIIKDIFIDESVCGEKIIGIQMDGRDWYLNSRYDAKKAAKRWVQVCNIQDFYGVVVVLGLANLTYIKTLREEYPKIHIVVFEPDKYIWNKLLMEMDMEEIFKDQKLYIVAGQIGELYLMDLLNRLVDYSNYKYMQLMYSPNYDKIYEVEKLKAQKIMYDRIESIIVDRNTMFAFSEQVILNRYANLLASLQEYNAGSVKQCFSDIDFTKVPAIVVAAGPSLEKNIEELKKAKGKAFIIAVDSAVRALVSHGILPDMTATIDPQKAIHVLYEDERVKQIPILTSFDANRGILFHHQGQKFYFYTTFCVGEMIWSQYHKDYIKVESAGSVANDVFSFVRKIGFQTIILIGQDLAYTGDKVHADSSYGELRNNKATETKKELYQIKDIDGNRVYTDYAMDIYRRWIENQILLHKDLRVVDATEGGALIQGAEILSLSEAIEIYCKEEKQIYFEELFQNASKQYRQEEGKQVRKQLRELYDSMDSVKEKLKKAKRDYEKLELLNTKRKYSGSDFEHAIENVTKQNEWMTTAIEILLLNDFATKENYEVMEDIYSQEDTYGQLKSITDSGLKMVEKYQDSVDAFKEFFTYVMLWMRRIEKYVDEIEELIIEISEEQLIQMNDKFRIRWTKLMEERKKRNSR